MPAGRSADLAPRRRSEPPTPRPRRRASESRPPMDPRRFRSWLRTLPAPEQPIDLPVSFGASPRAHRLPSETVCEVSLPLIAATVLLVSSLAAPVRADPIDDYLRSEMSRRRIPGLGLAVARDGKIVRQSFYGLANVETQTPVSERSVFAIASLDKQITASGVLRAAELGLLRLDDPISKLRRRRSPRRDAPTSAVPHAGLPDSVAESPGGRGYTDYSTAQLLAHVSHLDRSAPARASASSIPTPDCSSPRSPPSGRAAAIGGRSCGASSSRLSRCSRWCR